MLLTPFNAWPDSEAAVVAWLTAQLADLDGLVVCTETGTEIVPPLIRVERIPGGWNDGITEESLMDVECFGGNRADMWSLARSANAAMLNLKGQRAAGFVFDEVDTDGGTGHIEYNNPTLRRALTTYRLTARVQATV